MIVGFSDHTHLLLEGNPSSDRLAAKVLLTCGASFRSKPSFYRLHVAAKD